MSLNRFMGIGNLTRNVEVRQVGQNNVARFAIAMNEKYKKQDGSITESTEYLEVEYWGNSGIFQYLLKGQQVFVEGSLKTEKWTGNDGVEKTTIKLKAREIQLLGNRQQTQQQPQTPAPAQPQYQQPAPARPQAPRPPVPQQQRPPVPPQYQQPAPQQSQSPYQNFSQPSASGYDQQVSYGETYDQDLPF